MAAPPKKPHLRERYDERQREVLDTCAGVLARHGYHGTSIDDLIAATGLTRGGLYHYIGSKPELLSRVLADLMAPLLEQARPIVDGPDAPATAIERLRALTRLAALTPPDAKGTLKLPGGSVVQITPPDRGAP